MGVGGGSGKGRVEVQASRDLCGADRPHAKIEAGLKLQSQAWIRCRDALQRAMNGLMIEVIALRSDPLHRLIGSSSTPTLTRDRLPCMSTSIPAGSERQETRERSASDQLYPQCIITTELYSLDEIWGLAPEVPMRDLRDAIPLVVLICAERKVDDEAEYDADSPEGSQRSLSATHE